MALTQEQQEQIEFQEAIEMARRNHEITMDRRRSRLESIRLAKEILIENSRSKPVDSRDLSAEDVTNFATLLDDYVNS